MAFDKTFDYYNTDPKTLKKASLLSFYNKLDSNSYEYNQMNFPHFPFSDTTPAVLPIVTINTGITPIHGLQNNRIVYMYDNLRSDLITNQSCLQVEEELHYVTYVFRNKPFKHTCLNKGTTILCVTDKEEYRLVEDLVVGDLVKTYKHGNRPIANITVGSFTNDPNNKNVCMYTMLKTADNDLLEDLTVTGHHGILVEKRTKHEHSPHWVDYKIENKFNVIASLSKQFKKLENINKYIYYNFSLKSDKKNKIVLVFGQMENK